MLLQKIKLLSVFCLLAGIATAQVKPAPKVTPKPAPKPVSTAAPVNPLKNSNDSASYAIGVSIANFYKQQGITSFNNALINKAIGDVMGGKTTLLDDATCNNAINTAINKASEQKAQKYITEGNTFLANNKKKPGVKVTPSGLQYEVITEGTGAKPGPTDRVTVHYRGTLINATEPFDESYKRGAPATFGLNQVISGWTEGLQLMTEGSKYKLYLPYQLGYGLRGSGANIPGGSTLIFEVELLKVEK